MWNSFMKKCFKGDELESGGHVKSFDAIHCEIMIRLSPYFIRDTSETLQDEFYFVLEYDLGLRGREQIKRLKKTDAWKSLEPNDSI